MAVTSASWARRSTIAALFLHLLLPEDRVLDEEKEHYPRAFSDGEIAYET